MSGEQPAPTRAPPASPGEVRATEKVAAAQATLNKTFSGTLLKLATMAGAGYLVWYMWQRSEEPLPEPLEHAVSKAVSVGGGAMQQRIEEIRGTYPGAASHVPSKDQQEAAKR